MIFSQFQRLSPSFKRLHLFLSSSYDGTDTTPLPPLPQQPQQQFKIDPNLILSISRLKPRRHATTLLIFCKLRKPSAFEESLQHIKITFSISREPLAYQGNL
ncbi:unnamed protein product [Ectocarpus sp. 12 AP-2014]